jgi:ATP synthase protein I
VEVTTQGTRHPEPGVRDGLAVNLAGVALLLLVGLVVAAVGGALGLALAGRPQALGAVLGAGMTTGFYLLGTVTVSLVAAYAPRASLLVALLTYVLQVAALALVLARVQASPAAGSTVDVAWTGAAVVVATVAWLVLLVVRAVRSTPRTDPPPPEVSEEGVGR